MIRIGSVRHGDRSVDILPQSFWGAKNNVYTIVVGKNGVGKSRLLNSIAKAGIDFSESEQASMGVSDMCVGRDPLVIAVSTSPFDKFPVLSRSDSSRRDRYKYVGMRGESRVFASSAVSLIASASKGLLQKILNGSNSADFLEVFRALSFSTQAEFIFKPAFSRSRSHAEFFRRSPSQYFDFITTDGEDLLRVDARFQRVLEGLSTEEKSSIGYAMSNVAQFFDERKAVRLSIDFDSNEISLDDQEALPHVVKSILILMDVGLIRLMDLNLHKFEYGVLSLRRASSGEQCLIVLMLGIAGHIEDGSLILIDEPEVSLHPRWQEDFMQLLVRSFWRYKHCQFVIATHSPQVVSRLDKENSFVLSLSDFALHDGASFNNKSADFQLAELFDAPGFMNEYISRAAFDLIARVRAHKKVTYEISHDMCKLKALRGKLSAMDPIVKLIDSVEELVHYYANHI